MVRKNNLQEALFVSRKNTVLYNSQFGFRKGHSCQLAIAELVGEILKSREQKKQTLSIFLNFSKAFDTVKHDILLKKLDKYGIKGIVNKRFDSYLSNRKIRVKCKTNSATDIVTSDDLSVTYGTAPR